MLNQLLQNDHIIIDDTINTWEDAIKKAAQPLLNSHSITDNYVESIIKNHNTMGPYYVIAPGIAMPHARSEYGALKLDLSLLVLKNPTKFNSQENDPVNIVTMFSAPDNDSHLEMLMKLSELFSNESDIQSILNSNSVEEISTIIKKY